MPQPTNATALVDLHPTLHNEHVNVKAFGAVGDGTTDDTAAVQAAITALDNGATIIGTIFFPKGVYKISDPIVIGNSTKYVSLSIKGQDYHSASNGILDTVILKPTNVNEDAIQFNCAPSVTSSLMIDGIQVLYASIGTGVAFNFAAGSQTTGPIVTNCIAQLAGVGFFIGDSVNARLSNCSAVSCGKGLKISGGTPNLPQFENCTFQNCTTAGVSVEGAVTAARFTSCVFQNNTGPGLDIPTGAHGLHNPVFDACWWEFPGTDMIRVSGAGFGSGSMSNPTFIGCTFDGSTNLRHVINIVASAASNVHVFTPVFINCYTVNLGGGRVLYTATDPTNSSDPGFWGVTWIGPQPGGGFKGLHTAGSGGTGYVALLGTQVPDWVMESSTVYGISPPYMRLDTGVDVNADFVQSKAGAYHEFKENGTTDAAAGAVNTFRLFARDNGAGKTQFCVRFNTGAVQVLATEA